MKIIFSTTRLANQPLCRFYFAYGEDDDGAIYYAFDIFSIQLLHKMVVEHGIAAAKHFRATMRAQLAEQVNAKMNRLRSPYQQIDTNSLAVPYRTHAEVLAMFGVVS